MKNVLLIHVLILPSLFVSMMVGCYTCLQAQNILSKISIIV